MRISPDLVYVVESTLYATWLLHSLASNLVAACRQATSSLLLLIIQCLVLELELEPSAKIVGMGERGHPNFLNYYLTITEIIETATNRFQFLDE